MRAHPTSRRVRHFSKPPAAVQPCLLCGDFTDDQAHFLGNCETVQQARGKLHKRLLPVIAPNNPQHLLCSLLMAPGLSPPAVQMTMILNFAIWKTRTEVVPGREPHQTRLVNRIVAIAESLFRDLKIPNKADADPSMVKRKSRTPSVC